LAGCELASGGCLFAHAQMIPQVGDKFKHMFENMLQMSVGGGIVFLSNKCSKTFPKVESQERKTRSIR
jgi:hypothetical protein